MCARFLRLGTGTKQLNVTLSPIEHSKGVQQTNLLQKCQHGSVVMAPANAANEFYYCSRSGSSSLKAFASQSESFHCFIAFLTTAGQT